MNDTAQLGISKNDVKRIARVTIAEQTCRIGIVVRTVIAKENVSTAFCSLQTIKAECGLEIVL